MTMRSAIQGRIWLIGGTRESVTIAQAIASEGFPCTITVTTESAQTLYPENLNLRVQVGRLNSSQLPAFFERESIVAVVDASHPYAVEISQTAMTLTREKKIPYLRYERPTIESDHQVLEYDSFATLLAGNYLAGKRVFLTVGYQALPLFQSWQNRAILFARLLPNLTSLEVALKAGFTPDRLIALRPPISAELEKALWQQWQISLVVTKASGQAGGEDIKRQVARKLGIPLIVIARPKLLYPQQTSHLSKVIIFCRQHLFRVQ